MSHELLEPHRDLSVDEKRLAGIAYAFYALAAFGLWVPSILGVVLNYLKFPDSSPVAASHHRWMIRTFWMGTAWLIVGVILIPAVIGFPILAALFVWWIYRVVKGSLALYDGRPVVASAFLP